MESTQNPTRTEKTEFVPPRHWVSPEELNESYWSDPAMQSLRGQEFHDKPIETLEMIERMDKSGIRRRDFLTLMGASMAMASMACARRPVHKIIPYVVKPQEITPGVSNFYASVDPETGYGILAKTREGRPIKLEGNPEHPLNQGTLGPRGQAALLRLYDPDRLKNPLVYDRGSSGKGKAANWEEVDKAILGRLKDARSVRILTGELNSPSSRRLAEEFLGAFSRGDLVEFDVLAMDDVARGQELSYGTSVTPDFALDRADVILSLGADFLGTWGPSEKFQREWSLRRKLNSEDPQRATLSKVIVFEPVMTITGASSDERHPVRPGDEVKVALAIAYELIVNQKKSRFAGDTLVTASLNGYKPETVAQDLALPEGAKTLKEIADLLWSARGKSVVLGGSLASRTDDQVALQVAANLLNSVLENEGAVVEAGASIPRPTTRGFAALRRLINEMKAGQVDVLILNETNPLYSLEGVGEFAAALKNVKTVIRASQFEDESAKVSDFALPTHHFLENWGDYQSQRGVFALQQPTIAPLYDSRSFEDMLLTWVRKGQFSVSGLAKRIAPAVKENTWHDYLKENWKDQIYPQGGSGDFQTFWEKSLEKGVFLSGSRSSGGTRSFRTSALQVLPRYRGATEGIQLALYAKAGIWDGRDANNPWLQELPDAVSTATWDNYVNIGPHLAKKLGVNTHDIVEIQSGELKIELPVLVQPGLHSQVVSIAVGYGRSSAGRVGTAVGKNAFPFVTEKDGLLVFSGREAKVNKTGKYYKIALTQLHHLSENRPIINDISLDEYRKDPGAANHTDPHLKFDTVPTMWPKHEYKGHRWGMAIDLNSCTGCGACIVACQAENNIPVVGRDNVRVSREMHWIRIDRYYSGDPERPEVIFQPMLCQHCENAPCETVCPVLATVHDDEGLNVQAYNRCVGTRYCQNNCPYKVRRFNFFDHWKKYEASMNLTWNPDVTVRTRGIMEKCTFCIQRINETKLNVKTLGRKLADGEIKMACQQTCATDAIVFGDMNDPNARVTKLIKDQRTFRSLEVLNTAPAVNYMTKVRNRKPSEHDHPAEHGDQVTEEAHS